MNQLQKLISASALAVIAYGPSANAQEEDRKVGKKFPIRTQPLLNRKSLAIPKKLPTLQAKKAGRGGPERFKPRKAREAPPVRLTAPPRGTGKDGTSFADIKKASGKQCKPYRPDTKVLFDFTGDIKELVHVVAKMTCKNFILTNKVRSQKFEIVSQSPITAAAAWQAFLSALEANDFSLVRVGSYYKLIQATDGTRSPVPMYKSANGKGPPMYDRMVTIIWKLEHATDANKVVNYLNIFKSSRGQIHPFPGSTTIIATDFGTSIKRLQDILKEIDQPGGVEQVHIVEVEHASANEMAEKLTQIFEPQKATPGRATSASRRLKVTKNTAGQKDDDGVSVSKIISDERTNRLIIIASQPAFKQILGVMRKLDIPDTDISGGQIHVLKLKHADAEELASTLSSLAQGNSATRRPTTRTARTKTAAKKKTGSTSAALFEGEVKITADKATNSLVITASRSDLGSVRKVIEQLDVARFQVFVEALILEVSVNRDRRLGTSWHGVVAPTIGGEQSPILFGNTPSSELSSLLASTNPLSLASLLGFAGAVRGPTAPGTESIVQGGIPAIGVVVQALQSSNDVNVVSTPHLLTMDNEEAEIQVNEKRPFPSGLSLGGLGGLANQLGGAAGAAAGALGNVGGLGLGAVSFNREDIGLTLKLKPQINDEDYVRLEIDQELSDVAGTDQVTGQTITSKRAAKTVVEVRSQDSVVIGGLVRDREDDRRGQDAPAGRSAADRLAVQAPAAHGGEGQPAADHHALHHPRTGRLPEDLRAQDGGAKRLHRPLLRHLRRERRVPRQDRLEPKAGPPGAVPPGAQTRDAKGRERWSWRARRDGDQARGGIHDRS